MGAIRVASDPVNQLKLSIEGRSGCPIQLRSCDSRLSVRKYAKDNEYNPRLVAQASKQARFSEVNCGSYSFVAPKVFAIGAGPCGFNWFDMEYAHGEKLR